MDARGIGCQACRQQTFRFFYFYAEFLILKRILIITILILDKDFRNPKAFTVSHFVIPKQVGLLASGHLNPALGLGLALIASV